MKNQLVSLSAVLLISSFSAKAQMCTDLFTEVAISNTNKWIPHKGFTSHQNQLDPVKLAKYKLALSEDKKQLLNLDTVNGKPEILGDILVSDTKYFFEWASKQEHQEWMKAKGISQDHMNEILKADSQNSGKGFYISLDPFDSVGYGDAMTAFKTNGPVVVLQFLDNRTIDHGSNTAMVKKLGAAGIDAIRNYSYKSTWLSVISNRHLQEPNLAPPEAVDQIFKTLDYSDARNFTHFDKFSKNDLERIPTDKPIRDFILGKKLNLKELAAIKTPFKLSPGIGVSRLPDAMVQNYVLQSVKHAMNAKNEHEFLLALNNLKDIEVSAINVSAIQASLKITNSEAKPIYRSILDFYDLQAVVHATKDNLENVKNLETSSSKAKRMLSKLDSKSINSFESLIAIVEKVYGIKLEFRDSSLQKKVKLNDAQEFMVELNSYLYKTPKHRSSSTKSIQFVIEHLPIEKMVDGEIFDLFSEKLRRKVTDFLDNKNLNREEKDKALKAIRIASFQEAINLMLRRPKQSFRLAGKHSKLRDSQDTSLVFMSIAPFKEHNHLVSRILNEIFKKRNDPKAQFDLDLPLKDLDQVIRPRSARSQLVTGSVLKAWVAQAKDDQDFVNRSRWALEMFNKTYSESER